ncbi:MAG: hypothetical protein AB9842_03450 [Bacteroidales bacterium]
MKKWLLILFLPIAFSCDKDKGIQNNPIQNPVYAGHLNTNMFSENLTPNIFLTYTWSQCGYGDCTDSIDIRSDGEYDFLLAARFLNPQLFFSPACCPPPIDCQPDGIVYRITSQNSIKIACRSQIWQNMNLNWADTIPEGYRIDTINNWQSNTLIWSLVFEGQNGPWYYAVGDKYIAFRSGDSTHYKYGWFKVGINYDLNLLFKGYAIEN